ncbi:MAG: hypothetical protein R3266_05275 [Gemmatimonadota bacterium]|nr:hypothetical protein [Gemmatimonadota bacterium]
MRSGFGGSTRAGAVGLLALALGAIGPPSIEAQARRGVQERQTRTAPGGEAERGDQRRGQNLVDRFARRVGEALHLDRPTTARLVGELQRTRAERALINAEARTARLELAQLVQANPADEKRIEALLDELLDLELRRARVAADEQRRLAEFLTPLQRARVLWLQERLARQALQRETDRPPP